jgi:hypothetical protein
MEKHEPVLNRRFRLRNRQILCRYGVGSAEADAIFDLELAGWTRHQVVKLRRRRSDLLPAGWTPDEIAALLDGAAA